MDYKSYSAKPSEIQHKWYIIDATNLVLGRLASVVATYLRGKHKAIYTPHIDCGDNIIVINCEKIATTGNKLSQKKFFWHTGYVGGIKEKLWSKVLGGNNPERLLLKSVERMISKNPLGRAQMKKLYLYKGSEHPHLGQKPEVLDVKAMNVKNFKRGL